MRPRPNWLPPLLVALAALLPFLPALGGGFLYDDVSFRDDPVFMLHPWRGAWAALWSARGLHRLTLCWDVWLWGPAHPGGFHLTNLLIHAAAALTALAAGRAFLQALLPKTPPAVRDRIATLGAVLFATHPLQGAAACYVVQRAELLAGLFSLLALLAFLRGRAAEGVRRRSAWWTGAALALTAGWLSKDNAVAIPGLLLATELALRLAGAGRARRTALFCLLLFGLDAALAVWLEPGIVGRTAGTVAAPPASPAWTTAPHLDRGAYALTQLGVLVRYLRLLVLPLGQRLDYDWRLDTDPWTLRPLFSLAVLAALFAGAWAWRRRSVLPLWAMAWFLASLSPTSSLVPIADVIMEQRPYTALWGAALATGAFLAAATGWRRTAGLTACLCLSVCTLARSVTWAHPERLWRESARACPGKFRPWEGLGEAEEAAGGHRRAEFAFRRALAVDPLEGRVGRNLGHILAGQGRHEEAVPVLLEALKVSPGEASATLDLDISLQALGRGQEAVEPLRKAAALNPDYAMLHYNLGVALIHLGRDPEAVGPLGKAVALTEDPAWLLGREGIESRRMPPSPPRAALSMALCRAGRPAEARQALAPALERHPESREVWTASGMASSALGDAEGVRRAREALGRLPR